MTDAQHRTPREQAMGSGLPAPETAPAAPSSPTGGSHEPGLGVGGGSREPGPGMGVGSREPGPGAGIGGEHTSGTGSALLHHDERDKFGLRLQQALSTFVESPRQAVEEADALFEETVRHLTDTLTERRRTLRAGWQGHDTEAHTEELRLALRQYREATERLLQI